MSLVKLVGAEGGVTPGAPGTVYNTYKSIFVPINSRHTLQYINTRIMASSLSKKPSTKTGRNLQFSQSGAFSPTQFYKFSFLTPCKHQGRQRHEWKVPVQVRVLHEFTPTRLLDDARDPILAAEADWWPCLRDPGLRDVAPGTRDHLHVTGEETEAEEHPTCSDPQAATPAFNAGES